MVGQQQREQLRTLNASQTTNSMRNNMHPSTVRVVFGLTLIMSRLMYASPSWSGNINVVCVSTNQQLFTKSVKWGVTSKSYQAADIFDVRDEKLFSVMCRPNWSNHCLHSCIICCRVNVALRCPSRTSLRLRINCTELNFQFTKSKFGNNC